MDILLIEDSNASKTHRSCLIVEIGCFSIGYKPITNSKKNITKE